MTISNLSRMLQYFLFKTSVPHGEGTFRGTACDLAKPGHVGCAAEASEKAGSIMECGERWPALRSLP